jgi:hypothetical protein
VFSVRSVQSSYKEELVGFRSSKWAVSRELGSTRRWQSKMMNRGHSVFAKCSNKLYNCAINPVINPKSWKYVVHSNIFQKVVIFFHGTLKSPTISPTSQFGPLCIFKSKSSTIRFCLLATCSRWFLARGFFYPEDRGNTFLQNVGSHKNYTAPHPKRRHSSLINFVNTNVWMNIQRGGIR